MSEPFFDYIKNNRRTISNKMYGDKAGEKKYTRLEYLKLSEVEFPEVSLKEALLNRKSNSNFSSSPVSLTSLSQLLGMSIAKIEGSKGSKQYPFPSGGGLYPMESYLLVLNVLGLDTGIYHYSSESHSVAKLRDDSEELQKLAQEFLVPMATTTLPGVYLLMTMEKSRSFTKYGSLSYLLALVEAGHRGQNICLVAPTVGLSCCPMGVPLYDEVHKLLTLDGVGEHYVYGLAIGVPKD